MAFQDNLALEQTIVAYSELWAFNFVLCDFNFLR
jgi:hypothetical protein